MADTTPSTASGTPASFVTGVYGQTKSGKTTLTATAAAYVWKKYHRITRLYTSDLGGFGSKMLSLIRYGIVQAYYPRTHVNPFEVMEDISHGAWPETILVPETGMADPQVRMIMPRSIRHRLICTCGEVAGTFNTAAELSMASVECSSCHKVVTPTTCARTTEILVEAPGFDQVGLHIYDSLSSLCEWGLETMADMAAHGQVGDAMDAATAFKQGRYAFGLNSKSHFGFVQNRVPKWIANIRGIPNQVLSPIATFLVEASKGDDESGGIPIYGPKIAGNARTSTVGQWLGHLLYSAIEPDDNGVMRHRLWTTTHVDPRDPRAIPYVAGHRGEPGIPDFLQDNLDAAGTSVIPFSGCSLEHFFTLLDEQAERIAQRDAEEFADAPALNPLPKQEEKVIGERSPVAEGSTPSPSRIGRGVGRRAPGRAVGKPAAVAAPAPAIEAPVPTQPPVPVPAPPTVTERPPETPMAPVELSPAGVVLAAAAMAATVTTVDPNSSTPQPPARAPLRIGRRPRPLV